MFVSPFEVLTTSSFLEQYFDERVPVLFVSPVYQHGHKNECKCKYEMSSGMHTHMCDIPIMRHTAHQCRIVTDPCLFVLATKVFHFSTPVSKTAHAGQRRWMTASLSPRFSTPHPHKLSSYNLHKVSLYLTFFFCPHCSPSPCPLPASTSPTTFRFLCHCSTEFCQNRQTL